jgi:hypothetical protein
MKSRTWRATNLRIGCREGARDPQNSARLCAGLADRDDQVGWRVLTTRRPLADLVGGEAGNLRGAVRRLDRDLKRIES